MAKMNMSYLEFGEFTIDFLNDCLHAIAQICETNQLLTMVHQLIPSLRISLD
jgi:hypothetical protein